ncbi:5-methylcytosine-specific restriction endonuclease system specificity protein McrC [Guyparkeria sp. GHLCS8-2]|uniref:5-methylcytosine-specific restriction endonuclease system specificity protein McrC n=1 Tax=Guyparkeria halopsychrophila TaxID=3139421 RepID=UPI0037C8A92E
MTPLSSHPSEANVAEPASRRLGKIPVRNLWLLMLYASDLYRTQPLSSSVAVEEAPDELPDLVAGLLADAVERRQRRQLSVGYRHREVTLDRVRGRIDWLQTERHQLLSQGKVACRFDELTVDTPRNRFVRAALERIATKVNRRALAHRCKTLADNLKLMGVRGELPSRRQIDTARFGRHETDDRSMVAAAKLAFDLSLPTEEAGAHQLARPDRDIHWVRRLFEKAVCGFFEVNLAGQGWKVKGGKQLTWPVEEQTDGIDRILPAMKTDIVLDHRADGRRIVIDTKFTTLLTRGWYREHSLRSGYLYQIYAYLRSQVEQGDPLADNASGLLLHPAVDSDMDEHVDMQGHRIQFSAVDLCASPKQIRERLLRVMETV